MIYRLPPINLSYADFKADLWAILRRNLLRRNAGQAHLAGLLYMKQPKMSYTMAKEGQNLSHYRIMEYLIKTDHTVSVVVEDTIINVSKLKVIDKTRNHK